MRCLLSVQRHTAHISHEVIVVDDASTDDTREGLPLLDGIRVIRSEENQGFAHNNNKAAAVARGKYVLFLNNDTEVHAGWLDEMLKVIEGLPNVGMVGSKLLFPDGTLQHAGVGFSYGALYPISPFHIQYKRPAGESTLMYECGAVTAACALMPLQLFLVLGGFDEGFKMGYEDVDLCLRVRAAGHRIVYTPHSVVTHFESLSAGRFVASRRNIELLHHKWLDRIDTFECDYRKIEKPTASGQLRPPCTVVVAVHDHLGAAAPCLENIWYTLGVNDDLIIVDDGSVGATARFLQIFVQEHPGRCVLIRNQERQGLAKAWRAGLDAAANAYAVVVLCTLRVLEGWIDRLVQHLEANAKVGALCATETDGDCMITQRLLSPATKGQGGLALPDATVSGQVEVTSMLKSGLIAGARDQLAQLVSAHADGVPGGHPQRWSRALQRQGLDLAIAADVTTYKLNQVFPFSGDASRTQYLQNVAAALDDSGQVSAHAAIPVSIIVVARDFSEAFVKTLDALVAKTPGRWELVVVDDGSSTSLAAPFARLVQGHTNICKTHFIRNETGRGFPAAINQGLAVSQGRLLVVMNGDVLVTPQWLPRMNALLQVNPTIGVVAPCANVGPPPQMCDPANFSDPPMPVDAFAEQRAPDSLAAFGGMPRVAGICLAIKREVIETVGGFDPRYAEEGGDVEDFCLRATRRGYLLALAADVYVEHLGCLSQRFLDLHPRRAPSVGWLRFCERWQHPVACSDTDGLGQIFRPGFHPVTDFVPLIAKVDTTPTETSRPLSTHPFLAASAR